MTGVGFIVGTHHSRVLASSGLDAVGAVPMGTADNYYRTPNVRDPGTYNYIGLWDPEFKAEHRIKYDHR